MCCVPEAAAREVYPPLPDAFPARWPQALPAMQGSISTGSPCFLRTVPRRCRLLAALCCAVLCCAALLWPLAPHAGGRQEAAAVAAAHGFRRIFFSTEQFTLYGLLRAGKGDTLRVYIEGDGRAWLTRTRPSTDPTPKIPVSLRLAAADPSEDSVLYLARPCQFVEGSNRRSCERRWWTYARLAREVIESIDDAVQQAKEQVKAAHVALIGYSGGGGAAVLTAARRRDVVYLATIAGNLHAAAWTAYHHVSPLSGSLEPFDSAAAVAAIPQWHISGSSDRIVPPFISREFCAAVGPAAQCLTLPDMAHGGAWENMWRAPVRLPELHTGNDKGSTAMTTTATPAAAAPQAARQEAPQPPRTPDSSPRQEQPALPMTAPAAPLALTPAGTGSTGTAATAHSGTAGGVRSSGTAAGTHNSGTAAGLLGDLGDLLGSPRSSANHATATGGTTGGNTSDTTLNGNNSATSAAAPAAPLALTPAGTPAGPPRLPLR